MSRSGIRGFLPRVVLGLVLFFLVGAFPAFAATNGGTGPWPTHAVTLVVPFAEGNESSLFYALQKEAFLRITKQSLEAKYLSGRAGADAWAVIDDTGDDGYTLTGVNLPHVLLRSLQVNSGVDASALRICHIAAYTPVALWVPMDSPFRTLDDFVQAARKKPGALIISGPGTFSAAQLAALRFDRLAGIRTTYMPFAGSGEAAKTAMRGNAVAFWGHSVPLPAYAGMVRPLAVAGKERSPSLPAAPTFMELEYPLVEGVYRGIAVSQQVPEPVQRVIADTFSRVLRDPALQAAAVRQGFVPVDVPFERIPEFVQELRTYYEETARDLELVQ